MAQYANKRYQKKRMAEINVVPYIDVMLVLLTIFMITAPLLTEGYRVQLPEARAKPVAKSKQPPIVVSIDASGRLYVNLGARPKQPVSSKVLIARVVARRKQYPDLPILIQGDVQADYGKVINAMSALNEAGINNFSLVTKPTRSH
ncbi:MAG: protein TolR [Gammaproteobacteria bacterium]|jgi:biopolymer transport protein TolR